MHSLNAAVGLIALVAAAAIWFIGGKHTPKLVVLLIMTGVSGLVGTPLGSGIRHAVDWANECAARFTTRWTGAAVTGLLAAIAVYALAMRLKDNKKVDHLTLGLAAVVPVAAATIPGPLGAGVYSVITGITGLAGQAIGKAFAIA
jgi:hypothetical protein